MNAKHALTQVHEDAVTTVGLLFGFPVTVLGVTFLAAGALGAANGYTTEAVQVGFLGILLYYVGLCVLVSTEVMDLDG